MKKNRMIGGSKVEARMMRGSNEEVMMMGGRRSLKNNEG